MKVQDKILIVVSILISAVSFYLFRNVDLVTDNSGQVKETIAKVISFENDVKSKPLDSFSWFEIKNDLDIRSGDSLLAMADSSALVKFIDGPELIIGENSLLKIEKRDKNTFLEMSMGQFKYKKSNHKKGEKVLINGKEFVADSKDVELEVQKSQKNTFVKLKKGKIAIVKKGKKKELKKDDEINLKTEEVAKLKLLTPLDAIVDPLSESLLMKWSGGLKDVASELLISTSFDFKKIIKKQNVEGESFNLLDLAPGRYYWKVKQNSAESSVGVFTVEKYPAPKILSPANEQKIELGDDGKAVVSLAWESPLKDGFELLIKSSQRGKKYRKIKTDKFKVNYQVSEVGLYAWKIKSAKKGSAFSKLQTFKVIPANNLDLTATTTQFVKTSSDTVFTFKWSGSSGSRAIFRLFKKDDLNNPIEERLTNSNEIELNNIKNGHYVWNVSLKDYPDIVSPFQNLEISTIVANLITPEKGTKVKTNTGEKMKFSWKNNSSEEINILISKSESFEEILHKITPGKDSSEYEIELKREGRFYWKIETSSKALGWIPSQVSHFDLGIKYLKPVEIEEVIYLSFDDESKKESYYLEWDEADKAVEYEVDVFKDAEMEKKLFSRAYKKERMDWKEDGTGSYFVRIRYKDEEGDYSPYSGVAKVIYPISPFKKADE